MSTAETPEVLWQWQTLALKQEIVIIIAKLLSEVGSLPARSLYQYLENVNKPVLEATGMNYEEFLQLLNDLDTVLIDDTDRYIVRERFPSLPVEVVHTEVIDEVSQVEILALKNEGVGILKNIISQLGPLPARGLYQYLKTNNKPVFDAIGQNYKHFLEFLNEGDNFSHIGLSNVNAAVRKAVGRNTTEQLELLKECKHFVVKGIDHTVYINNEMIKLKESFRLDCIIVEEDNTTELGNMDIGNQSTSPTDHKVIPPFVDPNSSNLVVQQNLDDFNISGCSSLILDYHQKTDDLKICSEGDCVCKDVCICRKTNPCESPVVEPVAINTGITIKSSNVDQLVSNIVCKNLCSAERDSLPQVINECSKDNPLLVNNKTIKDNSSVNTVMSKDSFMDYHLPSSNTKNKNPKSVNELCATNRPNISNSNALQTVRAQIATITRIMPDAFGFAKFDNHETVYISQSVLNASLKTSSARDIDRHCVGDRVYIDACRGSATDTCKWRATALSLNSDTGAYIDAQQSESTVTETNPAITSDKCGTITSTLTSGCKDSSVSITNDISGLYLRENTVPQVTESTELECPVTISLPFLNQSDDEKDRLLSRSQNQIDKINPEEDIVKKSTVDEILIESKNIINSDCPGNLNFDKDSDEKKASKNVLCGLQSSAFRDTTPLKLSSHSPAMQRGLKVIKKALAMRGPLPVRNLCGYFSFEDKTVRDLVGNNETKLLSFLSGNDNFLVEGSEHIVREKKNMKQSQLLVPKEAKIKDTVSNVKIVAPVSNVKIVALTSEQNTEIPTSSELNSCEINVSIDILVENRYNNEGLEHNLPDIATSFSFAEQSCLSENKTRIADDTPYHFHLKNSCSITDEAKSITSVLDNCSAKEKNIQVPDQVNCCSQIVDVCNHCSECIGVENDPEHDDRHPVAQQMVKTFDKCICHEPSVPYSHICEQNHYSKTSQSENMINISACAKKCATTQCDALDFDENSDEKNRSKKEPCGLQSSAFHDASPLKLSSHSPAMHRGLKVIKKALEIQAVRDLVGNNETKLMKFLSENDNFLVEAPDHIVRENSKQPQLLVPQEDTLKDTVSCIKTEALTPKQRTEILSSSELNSCETNVSIDIVTENRFNNRSLNHNLHDIAVSSSFVEQSCLSENKTRISEDTPYGLHLNNSCSITDKANSSTPILDNCCAKKKNLPVLDYCCSIILDGCNYCRGCTEIDSNIFDAESDDIHPVTKLIINTFDQYIGLEPSVPHSHICDQNHYSEASQDRCELLRETSNVKQTTKTKNSLERNYSETLPDIETIRKKYKCLEAIKSITQDKDRKIFSDNKMLKLYNNFTGPISELTSVISNSSETNNDGAGVLREELEQDTSPKAECIHEKTNYIFIRYCNSVEVFPSQIDRMSITTAVTNDYVDPQSRNINNFSASNQPCAHVISGTMQSISRINKLPSPTNISLEKSFEGKELRGDNEMNIFEHIDSSNGLAEQVNAKQLDALSFVNDFELDEEIYFSLSSSNSDSTDDELISADILDRLLKN